MNTLYGTRFSMNEARFEFDAINGLRVTGFGVIQARGEDHHVEGTCNCQAYKGSRVSIRVTGDQCECTFE